jgi:uncharacterized membrane protein YebE (DUF533 family)
VAMVHADGVVTPHELSFINDHIREINLSEGQLSVIGEDLQTPQDVYEMFSKIEEKTDKRDFFALARALSWCDGDFANQERHIIKCLEDKHIDSETQELLEESRSLVSEIELNCDQWNFKTDRSRNLFGFLNKRKKVA